MAQLKEQNIINLQKLTLKKLNVNYTTKKFKITAINMFNELRKTIMNKSENINRENILKSGNFEAERYSNYKMN